MSRFNTNFQVQATAPVRETGILGGFAFSAIKHDKEKGFVTVEFSDKRNRTIRKLISLTNKFADTPQKKEQFEDRTFAQLFEICQTVNREDFEVNEDSFDRACKYCISYLQGKLSQEKIYNAFIVVLAQKSNPQYAEIPKRSNTISLSKEELYISASEKELLTLKEVERKEPEGEIAPKEEAQPSASQDSQDLPF